MDKVSKTQQMRAVSRKAQKQGVSRRPGVNNDRFRFYLMWAVTAICFVALLCKALWLQVINHTYYQEKAMGAIVSTRMIHPNRGVIYDRQGTPLALSTPMKKLSFNAREYAQYKMEWEKAKAEKVKRLALLTKEEKDEVLADIAKKDARFDLDALAEATNTDVKKIHASMVKKTPVEGKPKILLPFSQYLVLSTNLPPKVADVVLSRKFVGVHQETEYKRFYPQPQPSAQLIGYMGYTNDKKSLYKGRAGLERLFDKRLAGTPGKMSFVRGAKGFGAVDDKLLEPEVAGENLITSIDARLQYILYTELEKAGRLRQARSASGIVADVTTGEIMAMSNWPSFNSNNLNERNDSNEKNRAVIDVFEPGSVVKPLTVTAALESGKFHKNSVLHTGGRIKVGSKVFNDHCGTSISLTKLIQCSSNTASIKIGQTLPRDGVANMFKKLGLGKKTALNFPSEVAGNVTAPNKRQKLKRANMTFGYAVEVSLAQLTQAYSILASEGKLHPLTFEKQIDPVEGEQIISEKTANDVLAMMQTITKGTGKRAAIPGYTIAGKTGTARKQFTDGRKGYYKDKYRALFIGVAPATNPRFITAIVVEDPVGDYGGGKVAAPVFKNVMQEVLRLYNIPMDKTF